MYNCSLNFWWYLIAIIFGLACGYIIGRIQQWKEDQDEILFKSKKAKR
jgi:uncharacterized membrane-anchored protein YhcB (DUF1043 family)